MQKTSKFWVNPAEAVFFISLILFIIGTVNIFSASFVLASEAFDDRYFFIKRHFISFICGIIAMIICAKINYRKINKFWQIFLISCTILFLAAVNFIGLEINGAQRWLQIGGFQFQPSEFAKLVIIIVTSAYLGEKISMRKKISLLTWPFLAALAIGAFVLKQPDMGTAVIIIALSILLYLLAGIPFKEIFGLCSGTSVLFIYFIYKAAYRAERVLAWLDPWSYSQTSGYQTVQSLLAIGSGGLTGLGLGFGTSKFHYLPEIHTDFAFANICQEMGFIGAFAVIALFIIFAWYGFKIAFMSKDNFGTLLAIGLTSLIVCQAIGNIAIISGVLPVTGTPLPFISFGGTSLITNMAAVGILISVCRNNDKKIAFDTDGEEYLPPEDPSKKRRLKRRHLKVVSEDTNQ